MTGHISKIRSQNGTRAGSAVGKMRKRSFFIFFTFFASFVSASYLYERSSFCKWGSTSPQEQGWSSQTSGSLAKLSSVFFVDRDHGWVAGANGTLLATENGGAKWSRKTLPEQKRNEALNDLWLFNPERGMLLGEYGMFNRRAGVDRSVRIFLLRSNDRGANWENGTLDRLSVNRIEQPGQPGQSATPATRKQNESSESVKPGMRLSDPILLRMAFADDKVGWAVGEAGTIQYTEDGGATWMMQDSSTRKLLYDVAAIDSKQAWVVGAGGKLLRTVDGGRSWEEKSSEVAQTLRAVHFVDSKHGWAVGSKGTIIATTNGGARWQQRTSGVELNLNDVFFVSSKEGPQRRPQGGGPKRAQERDGSPVIAGCCCIPRTAGRHGKASSSTQTLI